MNAGTATSKLKPTAEQLAVAFSLVDIIEAEKRESSFALFGAWGRGKSFTSDIVGEKLPQMVNVRFPSWLYPNKPECWVHLYRSIYDGLKKESALALYASVVRMNFERTGLVQAVASTFYVMVWLFATIPASDWEFLWLLIASMGPVALLFITRLASAVPRVLKHIRRVYWRVESHAEKLGLQETIGRDLRDLVSAWGSKKTRNVLRMIVILPFLFIVPFVVLLIYARLVEVSPSIEFWKRYLAISAWCVFCFVSFVLLCTIEWYRPAKTRILVIVEDLDRVSADHSLAITESISVFLSDSADDGLMHFLFLLDESALDDAIERLHGTRAHNIAYYFKERLFKAHIRLPTMTATEATATSTFIIEFDVMEKLLVAKGNRQAELSARSAELDEALRQLEQRRTSKIETKYNVVKEARTEEVVVRRGLSGLGSFRNKVMLGEEAFLDEVKVRHIPAVKEVRPPNEEELADFELHQQKLIRLAELNAENAKKAFEILVEQLQRDDDSIAALKKRLDHTDEGATRPRPISRIQDEERQKIAEIMGRLADQKDVIWGPRSIISFVRKFEMMKTLWEYLVIRSPIRQLEAWETSLILDTLYAELVDALSGTEVAEAPLDQAQAEQREQARRIAGYVI